MFYENVLHCIIYSFATCLNEFPLPHSNCNLELISQMVRIIIVLSTYASSFLEYESAAIRKQIKLTVTCVNDQNI